MTSLVFTWVGIVSLLAFIVAYAFIVLEEKLDMNKSKPALFVGTLIFVLIGIYYKVHGYDQAPLEHEIESMIYEITKIYFFLFVAMTYIESLIDRRVFEALKYNLVSKGYSYKKLFWITGTIAFFLSPVADNMTTALILSTVLLTIDATNPRFLVPGAINIVVAANAGGAWSPFGDITTLMVWNSGKGHFTDFLFLFLPAILGWLTTAGLLSFALPDTKPTLHADAEEVRMLKGAKVVMFLGVLTIAIAAVGHQLFALPAMWGMMFGFTLLQLFSYYLKRKHKERINVFHFVSRIEYDTLLFFFGILAAIGGLHFLGFLDIAAKLYNVIGATVMNVCIGFLSAIVDNVPVMSATLKANPSMGLPQWMLVTMTAGIGGSLISFGSAAGVGVMGRLKGIYTFGSHIKYFWTILVGYAVSLIIWYVQFEMLRIY